MATGTSTNGKAAAVVEEEVESAVGVMAISPLPAKRIRVPIIGTAPLIVNKFNEKAKLQLLANMQGKKEPKKPKDPEAEYQASLYRTAHGYGFPTVGFKSAIVSATRFYGKEVSMVRLRQCLFMQGVLSDDSSQILTPILGTPQLREDAVTVGVKGRDLRYRGEFLEWKALLDIRFITSMLDANSVVSLINAAGMGVGVGEWRPEKSGQNGTFVVDTKVKTIVTDF